VSRLEYRDITEAAIRISGRIRRVTVAPVDLREISSARRVKVHASEPRQAWLALEQLQYTGSFKARGAQNFVVASREAGTMPQAGVTIASGGNAGLAFAWAARQQGLKATVFLPTTAPAVKVAKLRGYGAEVHLVGAEYAEALTACREYAEATGALEGHAYDSPLMAAGAGTLVDEIRAQIPGLDTVVVAVGGGGLFAGVATAAQHHGLRTVAVEPENCRALNAALEAGKVVDVSVDSIAADSLGARRTSEMALYASQQDGVHSVLVSDLEIVRARRALWDQYHLVVEHGAAAALAGLSFPLRPSAYPARQTGRADKPNGPYTPSPMETIVVVLCGANTDPSDLAHRPEGRTVVGRRRK